jgi:DNA invertase Pin-like site-specific DNA recombinase
MGKCIIYARYSPRPDADTSDSADKQRAMCEKYAKKKGYKVVGYFEDKGKSRNDIDRAGLHDAIEALKKGEILLCYELSRFGAGHAAVVFEKEILDKGCKVEFVQGFSVADSPDTQLIRTIMYAIKDYERKMIGLRTQYRMRQMQAAGIPVSKKPPYGFRAVDKRLVPHKYEYPAVMTMLRLHSQGVTNSEIARQVVNEHGTKAVRGKNLYPKTVERVIARSKHGGYTDAIKG